MPLRSLQGTNSGIIAERNDGIIAFPMADDRGEQVWIHIMNQALQNISPSLPPPTNSTEDIDRFRAFRQRFESIANSKYDNGATEEDGTVRITAQDL